MIEFQLVEVSAIKDSSITSYRYLFVLFYAYLTIYTFQQLKLNQANINNFGGDIMPSKFRYINWLFDVKAWISGIIVWILSMIIGDYLKNPYFQFGFLEKLLLMTLVSFILYKLQVFIKGMFLRLINRLGFGRKYNNR